LPYSFEYDQLMSRVGAEIFAFKSPFNQNQKESSFLSSLHLVMADISLMIL